MNKKLLMLVVLSMVSFGTTFCGKKKSKSQSAPLTISYLNEDSLRAIDVLHGVIAARIMHKKKSSSDVSLDVQVAKEEKEKIERMQSRAHSKSPSHHRSSQARR